MSFTYSTALTADRDKLRFLVSDADATNFIFQDEELTGVLSLEPNIYMAAALALRSRMAAFVTKAVKYRVGAAGGNAALEVDRTQVVKSIQMLITTYEAKALSAIDEVFDRFAFDIDIYGRDVSEYQGIVDTSELI